MHGGWSTMRKTPWRGHTPPRAQTPWPPIPGKPTADTLGHMHGRNPDLAERIAVGPSKIDWPRTEHSCEERSTEASTTSRRAVSILVRSLSSVQSKMMAGRWAAVGGIALHLGDKLDNTPPERRLPCFFYNKNRHSLQMTAKIVMEVWAYLWKSSKKSVNWTVLLPEIVIKAPRSSVQMRSGVPSLCGQNPLILLLLLPPPPPILLTPSGCFIHLWR